MDEARSQQVKDVLRGALERERTVRAAFLETACGGDDTLRREVESLLASPELTRTVMGTTQLEAVGPSEGRGEPVVGRRIGPYEVVGEIGRGGMGSVYRARRADDQYHKQVAIKLIRRGMDTDLVLRRFVHERQILANLDHPNIARLLDGGATGDGAPYLVMEHIEGVRIDAYCDAARLGVRERLALFRQVCAAVHYAHQNLVVHRDIKPSNILVTADGVPKLLDFGIAKLLAPDLSPITALMTAAELRAMTPDYASPEQVRGEPITTASDVYSLGVLLYELLSGRRPYQVGGLPLHEMEKVVREREPPRPSAAVAGDPGATRPGAEGPAVPAEVIGHARNTPPPKLRRLLAGDLDNIVLKALRKEPSRRYTSVEQLSEDILRHLEGRPVGARQDTFTYRAAKFVKRHKGGVLAAALLLMTLVAGIAATARQARVARAERARAERRFNDVRTLANSLMFELHDAIQNLEGATPARALLVKRASQYLDSLARESGGDASLQRELATAYEKVGDIQGDPYSASLGDTRSAIGSYRKSLAIRESLTAVDAELRSELASSYLKVGDILWVSGDGKGALEIYDKARAVNQALSDADPGNRRARYDLTIDHQAIGDTLVEMGDLAGALDHHRKVLQIRSEMAAGGASDAHTRRGLAVAHVKVADVLTRQGHVAPALVAYEKATRALEDLVRGDPTNAQLRTVLGNTYQRTGEAFVKNGEPARAMKVLRQGLAMNERQLAADPSNAVVRRNAAGFENSICLAQAAAGAFAEAAASCGRALATVQALSDADPNNAQARRDVAMLSTELGGVLLRGGRRADAERVGRRGLALAEALLAAEPAKAQARDDLYDAKAGLGRILTAAHRLDDAVATQREALALVEGLVADSPTNADYGSSLAGIQLDLGRTRAAQAADPSAGTGARRERWGEAKEWFERSRDAYQDLRRRGLIGGAEAGRLEEVAREIARCERAIARLEKPR